MTDKANILLVDNSHNIVIVDGPVSEVFMTNAIGLWGSALFGSISTLGAGFVATLENTAHCFLAMDVSSNTIISSDLRAGILETDISYNVIRS